MTMNQIIGFFETFHPFRHLLFAILILVLGHWLMKFVTHWLERAMTRAQVEPTVTRFVTHVSYFILAAGVEGTVQEVQMLTTTLYTADNLRLTVPNSKIMQDTITNYSVMPTRRIELTVGVSYDDDLQQVKHVLAALIAEESRILKEPAPFVGVAKLGESSVDVVVQMWVQRADVRQVRSSFLEKIKCAFAQHAIRLS